MQDTREVKLTRANFYTFTFNAAPFPKRADTRLDFEPTGRRAYRVLLMRPEGERGLLRILTVTLVALFVIVASSLSCLALTSNGCAAAEPEHCK